MQKLWLALCLIFGLGLAPAQAQVVNNPTSTAPAGAYNSSPITCTDGKFCLLQTDINGLLKVNVAAGAASGCAGTAGTPCIVSGNGTAGTADAGVVTVQGIAAMTPIGISIASGKVASGAFASGSIASGAMVDLGAQADAAAAADNSTASLIALLKRTNQNLTTLNTTAGSAIPAGTNLIGKIGIDQTTPAVTNGVVVIGTTAGGVTPFFLQPVASDNHQVIKAGQGQVFWILAENNSATVNYLRFYNATTGFDGCNSATNLITQLQIPASTSVGGVNINLPLGLPFGTGISICVTSGYATNDTTAATATAMSITVGYK